MHGRRQVWSGRVCEGPSKQIVSIQETSEISLVLLKGVVDTIDLSFESGNLLLRAGAGLKRHAAKKTFHNAWSEEAVASF